MNIYSLTLESNSSITQTVAGNFYSSKSQDLVVINGSDKITVYTQNVNTGLLEVTQNILAFSQIRSAISYRPLGFAKDLLLLTSDSGMLSLVELIRCDSSSLIEGLKVHQTSKKIYVFKVIVGETLSRTGCRRVAVGTYVAKDPKGRAVILGAIEKNKLVYLTSKASGETNLTLSSPLEANIPQTITFAIAGLDVGYDNPLFCAIEAEYGDIEDNKSPVHTGEIKKTLSFYEIDLGLNQVIRRKNIPISKTAHSLLPVPQIENSQGGVILVSNERLELYSVKGERLSEVVLPNRLDNYKNKHLYQITSSCSYKLKSFFFLLLQNQLGDIFKLTVDNGIQLAVSYLCTDKIATSMVLLKTGYLFKANENSDHEFFSVLRHDPDPLAYLTNCLYVPRLIANSHYASQDQPAISSTITDFGRMLQSDIYFSGFESLQVFQNLAGQVDSKFADLVGDNIGQYYTITSGINGSHLKSMRFSIEIEELAKSSLPIKPKALFPVRKIHYPNSVAGVGEDKTDFLLLSIPGKTFVLTVSEKIEEVKEDMGFNTNAETLHLMDLMDGNGSRQGWAQVTNEEIRVISGSQQVTRTKVDGGQKIRLATSADDKLLLFTSTLQLHFYLQNKNSSTPQLDHQSKAELEIEVLCMTVFGGNSRSSSFMAAIGFIDSTVRIYSLDPRSTLTRLSLLSLQSPPESIVFSQGHIVIGTSSGTLSRAFVDPLTGALGEVRIRSVSDQPLKIFKEIGLKGLTDISTVDLHSQDKARAESLFQGHENNGLLICGSRVFYGHESSGVFDLKLVNIADERIVSLCKITGKFGDRCFVFLTETGLMKIVRIRNESSGPLIDKSLALTFSGRKLLVNSESMSLIVIESQCRTFSSEKLASKYSKMREYFRQQNKEIAEKIDGIPENASRLLKFAPKQKHWESRITIISPGSFKKVFAVEFQGNNKHILAAHITSFKDFENENFLVVSVCEDHDVLGNKFSNSWVATYSFEDFGKRIVLLHNTKLDFLSFALWGFKGRLLVGAGGFLRLYELGKKQLLKKNELKRRYNLINGIKTVNQRIYISDAADSVHMIRFNENENQFQEVADDILPRYITTFEILDFNTVAAADKFGNFFVLRLPQSAEEEVTEDFVTYKLRWENSYLNGAPVKFEQICAFYDVNGITSIQKVTNPRTSYEYIIAGNIEGKVSVYMPFETKSELDFFKHLELLMRSEEDGYEFITDRNHLLFRGYYSAVKGIVDGDLCEQIVHLKESKQRFVAENLERSVSELAKRFEDFRFKLV